MRKIDLYINDEYVCSSTEFRTCKEFVEEIRSDGDGLIFVDTGADLVMIEFKADDKIVARYNKGE